MQKLINKKKNPIDFIYTIDETWANYLPFLMKPQFKQWMETGGSALKKAKPVAFVMKERKIFHQDNAPTEKVALTMRKLTNLKYESLEHPTHSPDLAPSDVLIYYRIVAERA